MGGKNFRDPKNGNSFSEIFRLRLMLCLWDETKVHCGAYMQHILISEKKGSTKRDCFQFSFTQNSDYDECVSSWNINFPSTFHKLIKIQNRNEFLFVG